ncbi:MAG: hypothetical protein MJA27_34595 [Pseudanabaenales cyanobacterium]|nr:hypothetical protein [Pseudanabaenales cyanobacterium]
MTTPYTLHPTPRLHEMCSTQVRIAILFLLILPFIWFALAIDIVQVAAAKLRFAPNVALLLLIGMIIVDYSPCC